MGYAAKLRHEPASLMATKGYSPAQIASHLGHADGGALALRTYVHTDALDDASIVDDALSSSWSRVMLLAKGALTGLGRLHAFGYRLLTLSLAICSDLSPASRIVTSEVPWDRLVTFGPSGFAAYARVRYIPDPIREGQRESEADLDASPSEVEQWRALLQLLATETSDPSDCYFALWDGWVFPESARRWPTFGVPRGARIPHRSYFLFQGALSDAEIWGKPTAAGIWGRPEFSKGGTPAFVWPSDFTWCVAADIDPHWAGIGATAPTIERLLADRRLDAVAADPESAQPAYR